MVARQWAVLTNCGDLESARANSALAEIWSKKFVHNLNLVPLPIQPVESSVASDVTDRAQGDLEIVHVPDERRPGRTSVVIHTPDVVVGIAPASQAEDPPAGIARTLILDASWTHITSFPERETVRQSFVDTFARGRGRVWYVTNLSWDAALFGEVATETGSTGRSSELRLSGSVDTWPRQIGQVLPQIKPTDQVLIGLVPGRDDRGSLQRLRSDFAERTEHVQAFPSAPLSCGPGPGRDEMLEAVGLWLPTTVLVSAGPISEQHLLARHLEENTGGSPASVAISGGEYRLPNLQLVRQLDGGSRTQGRHSPLRTSFAGLVVVSYGADNTVQLAGAGLATSAQEALPKIRVNRRGKTPEQVVREVESAFSSRGHAIPAVRYLP